MERILLSLIVSFFVTVLVMPLVIKLTYKLKARQTILHYVDNHKSKSGTPTMGGIGFMLSVLITSLVFKSGDFSLMLITLVVTIGYGIVGFLDDFIKIFFKRNEGLSPIQKIVFQLIIASIVSVFAYYNPLVGGTLLLPFTFKSINLGIFAIPFYIVIFLAFTNAVNLTDGIDGLASSATFIYLLFFAVFIYLAFLINGQAESDEYFNLLIYAGALMGGMLGFLVFNGFPAKIFMGDTGALALGGGLACLSIMSNLSLMSPIIGIVYVATAVSVILQVGYYKLTKKRIFLMAPLHHHFERKGFHETKIVRLYSIATFLVGIACVFFSLIFYNF